MKKITKTEKNLTNDSNSGANISIVNKNNLTLVKKSEDKNLDRFALNIIKQETFTPVGPFESAWIHSKKNKKSEVELFMPFYNGISGSNFSKKITLEDIDFLLDSFLLYFKSLQEDSFEKKLNGDVLTKKCDLVKYGIIKNIFLSNNEKSFLVNSINNLKNSIKKKYIYPYSSCHGDFTLSNIIYNKANKKLVLIDFLDTYISSFLIDIAKIKQDLVYGWSFRREPRTAQMKAFIMGEHIYNHIQPIIDNKYMDLFRVVDCLNTLRIAPYVNDDYSREWILEVLK